MSLSLATLALSLTPALPLTPGDDPELYDPTVFRVFEVEFAQSNWWNILEGYYQAENGQMLETDLTVDGVTYNQVGVAFKGNSSFFNLPNNSEKASFSIKMDHVIPDQELYGVDNPQTNELGRKCLLARRLVERGVRFVQIYSGGNHNDNNWDAHGDLKINHDRHAGRTDKPIAGLIKDLKRRGMLDETLIVWTGEFGRQPTAEYAEGTGRDHNSYGFTLWLAGGGIKGGTSVGETDELGSAAVTDRFHVKNLHATVLTQLGFDPNGLSFNFGGLDQRLVGVESVLLVPLLQVAMLVPCPVRGARGARDLDTAHARFHAPARPQALDAVETLGVHLRVNAVETAGGLRLPGEIEDVGHE